MKKNLYIAPAVEVLDVVVEQGFAASVGIEGGGNPWATDEIED